MLSDAVLLTIAQRFFEVADPRSVALHRGPYGSVFAQVGDCSCELEPRNAVPIRPQSAVELVGIRLPGPTAPRPPDAGFAIFPDGVILPLSPRRHDDDAAPNLAAYWHRFIQLEPVLAPVALAYAAVLFSRRASGAQHLIAVAEDVSDDVGAERVAGMEGFTPLLVRREEDGATEIWFSSLCYLGEADLTPWYVHISSDGSLTIHCDRPRTV